jgi:hypothetical protein
MCGKSKNPLKILMDNKPISQGIKFYAIADYHTKILRAILVEDGSLSKFDKKHFPWGSSGQRVLDLVNLANLKPGHHYIIYTDTYYTSVHLAEELKNWVSE